jgi:hypothetical protein
VKRLRRAGLIGFAATVSLPQPVYAHSLNPLYCGSSPFWLAILESSGGFALLLGILLVLLLFHAFVLYKLVAVDRSPLAIMGLAAAIFLVSNTVTAVPGILAMSVAWNHDSPGEPVVISGSLFLIAVAVNALLTKLFFHDDGASEGTLFLAALIMSVSSHAVLLASNYAVWSM